jgi:hypothetical protein
MRPRIIMLAWALAVAACSMSAFAVENSPLKRGDNASGVIGTWTGESICTDPNRPACKNEVIVYRFVPVEGKSDVLTLYADKILNGERVPMSKLDFTYDEKKGTLSCEFVRRQTHGLWSFQVAGDVMEGTLVLLPNKQLGRKVKAHRVTEDKVPKAPPLTEYEGRTVSDRRSTASAE